MILKAYNEFQNYSTVWNISSTYVPKPQDHSGLNLKTIVAIAMVGGFFSSIIICAVGCFWYKIK